MNRLVIMLGLAMLLVLPLISADIIAPEYKPIEIQNKITNINDFSDYVFVSIGSLGEGLGEGFNERMCPVEKVPDNGFIRSYYKFCTISVYAVKKSDFNENLIFNYTEPVNYNETLAKERGKELINYFSSNAKEVIKNVDSYEEVSISSTKNSVINYYTVDLPKTLEEPTKIEVERNNLIYVYIIIPIIMLLIILAIVYKRRR